MPSQQEHCHLAGSNAMIRTPIIFAAAIFGLTISTVCAEEPSRMLSCTGLMFEPNGVSQSPKTLKLSLDPTQKVALDLGQGNVRARELSNNKIQLKFRTKDFVGEYFHYTGDLFLIYSSGHLARLTCKAEN
jgi:hypothetical protein